MTRIGNITLIIPTGNGTGGSGTTTARASNVEPSELPRRPPASQAGADRPPATMVRQAFGSDVVGSTLSSRAQLGYRVLADHVNHGRDPRRPYDGQVFLTDEKFGAELGSVSKRQVQRIRSELIAGAWVCLPKGDAGGRGNATIWYHLHPDGKPCPHSSCAVLQQRAAAGKANLLRAAARLRSSVIKDDRTDILSEPAAQNDASGVILSKSGSPLKDDTGVFVSEQRMTESTVKDDGNYAKDDKTGGAYKEELNHELFHELKSTTTAAIQHEEFPLKFAEQMDQEANLDEGALRRIWKGTRAIVPDATVEEIRIFFKQRAVEVYRNRKLDNPTGLMLSTIADWFPRRRVLERREAIDAEKKETAEYLKKYAEEMARDSLAV